MCGFFFTKGAPSNTQAALLKGWGYGLGFKSAA